MTLADWESASWAIVAIAFETVLRSLMLAALCGVAVWLLRSKTAALRFLVWQWLLLALLALPALIRLTPPALRTTRTVSQVEYAVLPRHLAAAVTTLNIGRNTSPVSRNPANKFAAWILAIPLVYLLVTSMLLARFIYNLRCLRRIAARGEYLADAKFKELAHEVWLTSGAFLKPRLASSDEISVPVTFDAGDSWILLPPSWRDWDEAKLRIVLTHEMAHVERGDSAHLHLASLTACLFWFHPLSWFLRRRLSALAEEACDEIVVAGPATPRQYANYLIDFADDVRRWHGRLITEATGVVRMPLLQRRIQKLFAVNHGAQRGRKAFAALALVLFVPALYLTAAARFADPQPPPKMIWPLWEQIEGLGDADVAALESALATNPEDLQTRMELVVYFGRSAKEQPFTTQLLWFIHHHPDIASLPMAQGMSLNGGPLSESLAEQVRAAWEEAIVKHAGSPVVLVNAASFIEQSDPERALQLLRQAQALDVVVPQQHETEIGIIYAAAELQAFRPDGRLNNIQMRPETAAKLRAQLESSTDPALLAAVGRTLVELYDPRRGGEEQTSRGLRLIRQAIALDPRNAKWTEALAWAQAEPQRRAAYDNPKMEPPQPGLIRIGSGVAEASLVSKVDPVYPPLALTGRLQGTVEFTVTVGADGKVERLALVRGHPLLVQAAKDAVLKWVYHPAMQDGKGVPFVTQVIVPFKLP